MDEPDAGVNRAQCPAAVDEYINVKPKSPHWEVGAFLFGERGYLLVYNSLK